MEQPTDGADTPRRGQRTETATPAGAAEAGAPEPEAGAGVAEAGAPGPEAPEPEPEPESHKARPPEPEAPDAPETDTTDTADTTEAPDTPDAPEPRTPRRPWPRRLRRTALVLALVLLVPVLAAQAALRVSYAGEPADGTRTRHQDALWLGHAWVDGRKTDADLAALGRRLATTGIRDLYVHTGPLEHDGTLPRGRYPKAHWLTDAVHEELPGVRVHAWLGDVLATETPDGMRLERAGTRAAVVRSAGQILDEGFDGVHFDLEPAHSGNGDYLALLDAVRRVTDERNVVLSVAAHQIDPLPALHSVAGALTGHPKWWSQEYFGQVARRVDQIAVMSYDTAQPLQSTYGGYVARQTSLALEVTPPTTDLLMGLPFYYESDPSHWGHAETVPAAVRGVRLGLSRTDPGRENFGVALYVDFAATEADWRAYREGWVSAPGAS
ncbi:hypothetical protein SUDANB145_02635 [Streptomyces sp. enrichment culture]|uniref:glycoside hydrolase family 18 protein n=1 Tax=Streptomyces sp. enrichment culture TaxID=1795815 RepID=UPI003F5613E1